MNSREQYEKYLFPNYAPLEIMPSHGKGVRLWDSQGREYIDFAAGIAVSALGHANPELVKVLHEQAQKLWHVSNLMATEPAIKLAKTLVEATFADQVFFSNSGAEANEAALKLARRYANEYYGEDKIEIIAFDNSFHGRTFFTVSVGGQEKYSSGFGPKPAGITHLPFNDIAALEAAVSDKTCAIIMEPILGESGVLPANADFIKRARALCDQHHALLIFDEIQTGVMRTGDLYAYMGIDEGKPVVPDILTTAKGLGGGFPIAATLAKEKVAKVFSVGVHGTTFGGNPMACAVANKVLELVTEPKMKGHIHMLSKQLRLAMESLKDEFGVFSEIRGSGLLLGCVLASQYEKRARDLLNLLLRHGVLALVAGENVLRLAPPLVMSEDELAVGMERMTAAVKEFV